MKKYIVLLISIVGVLFTTNVKAAKIKLPEKTDHEIVKVYLFRGAGCSHCYDFLTYFSDKFKDYEDYFQIAAYESWNNSTNQKLMLAVKKIVGEEENGSVPFIVVGDDYKLMGFGEKSGEEIIKAALKAYQDENYTDIVKKAIKDNNLSPKVETIAQAAKKESISVKDEYTKTDITEVYENHSAKKGLSDGAVIAIVFGVIILGFAGLVVLSRK